MTTPEQFRRRQRTEGAILIVLGVFTVTFAYISNERDAHQQDCVISVASDLNQSIVKGRRATDIMQKATTRLITNAFSGQIKTPKEVAEAKQDYADARARAHRARQTAPLPPDPEKVCR